MRSVAVVVALAACLHTGVWALRQTQASAPSFDGILNSVSYSPFTTAVHPDLEGSRPPEERIRAELKAIAPYTRAIRLYASTGGVEQVPKIAAEFGLKVTLGIWLGERAVGLMWKDDLDTAFRHLELYDRFGCPGEHVQISFRCVVRQGNIDQKDQKATDAFNARVHSCWLNPALPPAPATPPTAAAEKAGTK